MKCMAAFVFKQKVFEELFTFLQMEHGKIAPFMKCPPHITVLPPLETDFYRYSEFVAREGKKIHRGIAAGIEFRALGENLVLNCNLLHPLLDEVNLFREDAVRNLLYKFTYPVYNPHITILNEKPTQSLLDYVVGGWWEHFSSTFPIDFLSILTKERGDLVWQERSKATLAK